jgi:hypothetical protein
MFVRKGQVYLEQLKAKLNQFLNNFFQANSELAKQLKAKQNNL